MKSLESLVTKAQEAKSVVPLFSRDELRSIVEKNVEGSAQTSPGVPHSSTSLFKGLFMASLIGSFAVGALMWLQVGNTQGATVQTDNKDHSTQQSIAPSNSAAASQKVPVGTQSTTIQLNTEQNTKELASAASAASAIKRTPFIMVNAVELKNLGIVQKEDEFNAVIEEEYNEMEAPPQSKVYISMLGYPLDKDRLILRSKAIIKPNTSTTEAMTYDPAWNTTKPIGFSPFACAFYSDIDGDLSIAMSTSDHSPYVKSQDVARELRREFGQLAKDIAASFDHNFARNLSLPLDKRDYKYAKYLVPVAVDLSTNSAKKLAVFYYIPTQSFVRALSDEHREQLKKLMPMLAEDHLQIDYKGVSTAVEEDKVQTPSSITGIQHLDLNKDQLEAIGIHVDGTSISFSMDAFNDRNPQQTAPADEQQARQWQRRQELMAKLRLDLRDNYNYNTEPASVLYRRNIHLQLGCEKGNSIVPYTGWNYSVINPVSPIGFTANDYQIQTSKRMDGFNINRCVAQEIIGNSPLLIDKNKEFVTNSPEGMLVGTGVTIPVRIVLGTAQDAAPDSFLPKAGIDSAHYHVKVVDVFFAPTQEFVDRLPEPYHTQLVKELNLRDRIIKGELQISQACDELHKSQTQSMLDICNFPTADIQSLQVYPNPVVGNSLTCSFTAREKDSYNISLYDLSGKLELNMLQTTFLAGYNSITIPTKEVHPGVYVLSITSAKGVQATHRIIVQ